MDYKYNVAGLNLLCKVPYPLTIQDESEEFISQIKNDDESLKFDFEVEFLGTEELPEIDKNVHKEGLHLYYADEVEWKVHFCPAPGAKPYACVVWKKSNLHKIQCHYLLGKEEYLNYSRNIMNHVGLETLLRVEKGLLFHASFIRWRGKGILFCAPSGTGKSTQAKLWEIYEDAEILNGDRAAVRKEGNTWIAYGLPYAGSSGIYRNEKVELAAIVALRQSDKNSIQKMSRKEAVSYLYPEITIHRWEKGFVEDCWNVFMELLLDIPIYLLNCRIDKNAVEILKECLVQQ